MKAWMIKNKDGEYCDCCLWAYESILDGDIYKSQEEAEEDAVEWNKETDNVDKFKVVEITMAEGDLEEENKKLKQQLAEKEKDIDTLNKTICRIENEKANIIQKEMIDYLSFAKEIRKQVCDEIFKELQENTDCYFEERKCNSPHSQLPYIWFNEIRFRKFLNKIEKGE